MNKEIFTNENKGFSLVELIVVIAIMAVMTSVLAPSLLGYVEQSRMQKDDSAMGEVMNAIKLALADQNVYDECLTYSIKGNYSCYKDSNAKAAGTATSTSATAAIVDKVRVDGEDGKTTPYTYGTGADKNDWHYTDDARKADEEKYLPAGNMRGLTLTFTAVSNTNESKFELKEARVNKVNAEITSGATAKTGVKNQGVTDETKQTATLGTMKTGSTETQYLYNKLRAVIGDNISLSSQTYRNSEYTVFIRMGSMGGKDAAAQDAVAVYGQWNGTNLDDSSYNATTT